MLPPIFLSDRELTWEEVHERTPVNPYVQPRKRAKEHQYSKSTKRKKDRSAAGSEIQGGTESAGERSVGQPAKDKGKGKAVVRDEEEEGGSAEKESDDSSDESESSTSSSDSASEGAVPGSPGSDEGGSD
jgi:hypothetical protein